MMDHIHLVARRYAQAYYNLFNTDITFDSFKQMLRAEQYLHDHHEIISWLKVPSITDLVKHQILKKLLFGYYQTPHSLDHLITILLQGNRSFLIGYVLQEIADIYQERSGIHLFTVTSSHHLSEEDLVLLEKFLQRKKSGAVIYHHEIDTNLIAGIRLKSNIELWEYSVRKDLRAIELSLQK